LELNDDNVGKLKNIYKTKGGSVKRLKWCNFSTYVLSANDFCEMLNSFPNLEDLKLSSWRNEFTGAGNISLKNLKSLQVSECGNWILKFLSEALPSNVLQELDVHGIQEPDANFNALISKQSSIKKLEIRGDFNTLNGLRSLQLTSLRCILYEKTDLKAEQTEYLRNLISSQKNLKELDVLNESAYSFSFVDDATITDAISNLSNLEKLSFNIDGITTDSIKSIGKLPALKILELKTNREKSLEIFKELSSMNNSSIEQLLLDMWDFDIPQDTYTAFGQNWICLKVLRISLGTWHPVNFYAKAFPNLENLDIRFGESNNTVEFSKGFEAGSGTKQSNLKKLKLQFWGSEMIDSSGFFELLGMFPNLERLDMVSKFPFKADFINELANNLGSIKHLILSNIQVTNSEQFPAETIDALKILPSKLRYVKLTISNIQNVDFGFEGEQDPETCEKRDFTFQPLIDGLQGIYQTSDCSMANIRIYNNLVLTAGRDE
jgi:hypothetical protein